MKVVHSPSPNHNARPVNMEISCVVLHATASDNIEADVAWCCTPKPKNPNPVSYHVIIDRNGVVYDLVPIHRRAWHAGKSVFEGQNNVNNFSIGLSFANLNDGKQTYTDAQYEIGAELVSSWMSIYPAIMLNRITTHRVIALPQGRKTDPVGFDLERFSTLIINASI